MAVILDQQKLKSCARHGLGLLVLLKQSSFAYSTSTVVGHCVCTQTTECVAELSSLDLPTPHWADTVQLARGHFPGGCDVGSGVWMCVDSRTTHDQVWTILASRTDMLEVLSPTLLLVVLADGPEIRCYSVDSQTHALSCEPVKIENTSVKEYLNENTALCRFTTSLPLCLPRDQTASSVLSSAERFINDSSTLFYVSSKPSHVFSKDTSEEATVRNTLLSKTKPQNKWLTIVSSSQNVSHVSTDPISVELLTDHSQATDAPSLTVSKLLHEPCLKLILPVDVLVLVQLDSPLKEVAAILRQKIVWCLRAAPKSLTWERISGKERKEDVPCSVSVHHVAVWSQSSPVTVVYPHTLYSWEEPERTTPITEDDLRPYREDLHRRFCLGTSLPYLRVLRHSKPDSPWLSTNAALCTGPQLLSPHLYLKQTATGDGSVATVQGDYLYYHYMQGGFNDDGWGCAYRSLQTLWSWFLLQGYTKKVPPTHREIQECLVATGDRSVSLIGSKQWIGSLEVSTSLNQLLEVTCRIVPQIRGSDMGSLGRLLLEHFRTQGTPVMIGGGVLAHTILGVSFNELTGDTQFLILDPHYTDKEDIKTIIAKGKWCGWKPVSFWKEDACYNLCLPLRPDDVI